MSATRYFIGGLAVIGGVYYYDQNVKRIIPRSTVKHEAERFDKFASKNASKLGDKVSDVVEDAKHELTQQKDQLRKQWKSAPSLEEAKGAVVDYSRDVRDAANDQLPSSNPLVRSIDKYIDLVNEAAGTKTTQFSSVGRNVEVKPSMWDRFFHKTPDTVEDKLKKLDEKVQKKSEGLFTWSANKADEAKVEADRLAKEAKSKKNGLLSWGSNKADEAKGEADRLAKEAESKKNGLLSWGSNKADEAKGEADRLAKEAESKKNGFLNWGSNKADDVAAKANEVALDARAQKKSWFNWTSQKADEAKTTANQVALEAEEKLKSWLNWGAKKADQISDATSDATKSAQKSFDLVTRDAARATDDVVSFASQKLNELANTLSEAKDSFLARFTAEKAKAQEAHDNAKAHVDALLARFADAPGLDKQHELERAKQNLKQAFDHLKLYGEDVATDILNSLGRK